MKNSTKTAYVPVIFFTAHADPEYEIKGLDLGAVDYITKPFSRELLIKRIELHLLLERQRRELISYSRSLESEVDKKTKSIFELQNAILKTVANLVECRDNVTGGHIERTQNYLGILLDFLMEHGVYADELAKWDINLFIMSSQLHDVGKISIKDDILMKSGKLTDDEFEEMKKHTIFGAEIIRRIEESTTENAFLQYAEILACSHHEKWDGTGYPYGLKGDDIPLQGRLMAIVDVYDALTNDRPYKGAYTHDEAVKIMRKGLGTHFDPLINDIFLMHEQEFKNSEASRNYFKDSCNNMQPTGKLNSTMKVVANIVDIRDGGRSGHADRMRRYLEIFINALLRHERYKKEISTWDIELFLMSAPLHDVGKIAVADQLLNKKGKLTDEEFEGVKIHADFGLKIIQQIKENVNNSNLLHHAEALTGSHHEKWDGTGYPRGLKGEAIPLQGRMMAIVDVYDALTSDRPHRKMMSHQEAVAIVKSCSGTHFDPDLVTVFLECEKELSEVTALEH